MEFVKLLPVIFFIEDSGNEPVKKWLFTLTKEDRKKIGRDIRSIQLHWPVGGPLVANISVGLWEIRTKLDARIARILFIIHSGTVVLLHGFIKKTEKTPLQDIELAKKRIIKVRAKK